MDSPNTDDDHIQNDYHSMNVSCEIETQNEALTTTKSNEHPLLGTASQYRSVEFVSPHDISLLKLPGQAG